MKSRSDFRLKRLRFCLTGIRGTKGGLYLSCGSADAKLVTNAVANITRRRIVMMLVGGRMTVDEIKTEIEPSMLDFHLNILIQAGLVVKKDDTIALSDFGTNFMNGRDTF